MSNLRSPTPGMSVLAVRDLNRPAGMYRLTHVPVDDGPVKRAVFLLLPPLVTAVSIGWGRFVPAEASTSHASQFCTAMKPGVEADQRLHSTLADMSSRTVGNTKSQLLSEINTMLNSFRAAGVQLHAAPAKIRHSLTWDVLAEGRFKTAVGHATTKGQIRAAAQYVDGSHTEERPFVTYILSHKCGTLTSSGAFAIR